eukprot:6397696-Pyramimonas_sp.AAC.1
MCIRDRPPSPRAAGIPRQARARSSRPCSLLRTHAFCLLSGASKEEGRTSWPAACARPRGEPGTYSQKP